MTNREKMVSVFQDALSSVLPGNLVRDTLRYEAGFLMIEGKSYRLGDYGGVHVFGSGKASVETARAVGAVMGDRVTDGLVVSNYGATLDGITVFESSHPVLTEKSIRAAGTRRWPSLPSANSRGTRAFSFSAPGRTGSTAIRTPPAFSSIMQAGKGRRRSVSGSTIFSPGTTPTTFCSRPGT